MFGVLRRKCECYSLLTAILWRKVVMKTKAPGDGLAKL